MNRRTFLWGLAFEALSAPLVVEAQQVGRVPWIDFLSYGAPKTIASPEREAFRQGLRELGWIEGQTVTIEYRGAEGNPQRLPALARDLVQLKVDVIVTSGTGAIRAAKEATSTIPIVFVVLTDPVSRGLVKGFAHPGGNLTGLASQFDELLTKQPQLMKEGLPNLSRIALLSRAEDSPVFVSTAEAAARGLGLAVRALKVAEVGEYENAFRTAQRERAGGILVLPSPVFERAAPRADRACRKISTSGDLRVQRLRARRRAHVLWSEHSRDVPRQRALCRSHPEGS
jgi:ABC transporter substrate binding protein